MNMDANTWIAIAAIALSVLIGITLIYLLRKKIIGPETLSQAATLLEGVSVAGDGFISKMAEYARIAVRAVEQLAKIGAIEKDNDTKKTAAMNYVQQLAKVDDITLSPSDLETADLLIEAAVAELPRNKT